MDDDFFQSSYERFSEFHDSKVHILDSSGEKYVNNVTDNYIAAVPKKVEEKKLRLGDEVYDSLRKESLEYGNSIQNASRNEVLKKSFIKNLPKSYIDTRMIIGAAIVVFLILFFSFRSKSQKMI